MPYLVKLHNKILEFNKSDNEYCDYLSIGRFVHFNIMYYFRMNTFESNLVVNSFNRIGDFIKTLLDNHGYINCNQDLYITYVKCIYSIEAELSGIECDEVLLYNISKTYQKLMEGDENKLEFFISYINELPLNMMKEILLLSIKQLDTRVIVESELKSDHCTTIKDLYEIDSYSI